MLGDVLALGERTLFVLSATGVLKAIKMLDFKPMAFCVYHRCRNADEHEHMSVRAPTLPLFFNQHMLVAEQAAAKNAD